MDLVKRCPTCTAENAPTAARCGCGAFLIGIDLTERAAAASTPAPAPSSAAQEPLDAARSPGPRCSFADCAQDNPPGSATCVYCNRPLAVSAGGDPSDAVLNRETVAARHADPVARRTLISLPAGLDGRFAIEEPLKASGGEADLFIVRDRASGQRAVLKLYRHGVEPRTDVLERVSRAAPGQLVHLIEHGRDEGVPYELLEYCEHGSLRALFKGRPLPVEAARTLLVELADALLHLHECGIVHRDLKPENVLIRGLLPLDLVLTDFGISSVTDATMHYTTAARTLRYSAPEAGSNWVGRPTDYWALGMMLVEALTGRHPFEGLSEAVIAHWLVTRPIDVSGIGEARWRRLCRGLLARDPKSRWGEQEIRRWLAGDDTIIIADEGSPAAAGAASPYRVGDQECRTARELAVALATHWTLGVKDLKRGMLRAWLQNELRDHNLARAAADAEEALELSDDERLLRLLLRLDPQLPPVFKGYDISVSGLAALTREALKDHNEARQAVCELIDRRLLALVPNTGLQDALASFEQAKVEFEQAIERCARAGAPRQLVPEGREWQLRLLLLALEPPEGLAEGLRASARRAGARAARHCTWYRELGEIDAAGPATLAAMVLLGPAAAQAGMQTVRERARRELAALSVTIDSCAEVGAAHADARARLAALAEASSDEDEVLALPASVGALGLAMEGSLDALFAREVFQARPVSDAVRLAQLRRRIGGWASWRAGETWRDFGEQIELVDVLEHRAYRVELASQIELRRVPYQYSVPDVARMPLRAQATLDDVWSCEMPALPQFGAGFNPAQPQQLRCPLCDARARVEQQHAWGSTAYPFSTTFSCCERVGVQCQSRMVAADETPRAQGVPPFVLDFIEAQALEAASPERALAVVAPRIPARWLDGIADGAVKDSCTRMLAQSGADLRAGERFGAQRLRLTWTGLAEVRYRFAGKDYRVWIPDRVDATPIALDHPLPSPAQAAALAKAAAQTAAPVPEEASTPRAPARPAGPVQAQTPSSQTGHPGSTALGRIRLFAVWLGLLALGGWILAWIVNWKP